MNTHRYTLEHYKTPSSRYTCPSCGYKRKFTRYIDIQTGQHVADHVGRCDREQNCGYHFTPKQYFEDHPDHFGRSYIPLPTLKCIHPKPPSIFPTEIFNKSLTSYQYNHLVTYLLSLFDYKTVNQVIEKYCIGTSRYWSGSTVFWQIDQTGKIRGGKVMLYNSQTGRRIKEPFPHISWTHTILKLKDYNLQQCFFGEHLLNLFLDFPVAIVESEKTAIIASVYFPQFIWLSTGGKNGCKWTSWDVCKVLKGRKVVLWPDVSAFQDWKVKASSLIEYGLQVSISELLEKEATEKERSDGLDIADYLIRSPSLYSIVGKDSHPP